MEVRLDLARFIIVAAVAMLAVGGIGSILVLEPVPTTVEAVRLAANQPEHQGPHDSDMAAGAPAPGPPSPTAGPATGVVSPIGTEVDSPDRGATIIVTGEATATDPPKPAVVAAVAATPARARSNARAGGQRVVTARQASTRIGATDEADGDDEDSEEGGDKDDDEDDEDD